MNFSAKERDDITHKLTGLYEFYGKTFDAPAHLSFWLNAMRRFSTDEILKALSDVVGVEKYLPKPADVIKQIGSSRGEKNPSFAFNKPQDSKPCDPRIASAWATYIAQGIGFDLPNRLKHVPMDFSEAVEICNEHCARIGSWEGLLPEHRFER